MSISQLVDRATIVSTLGRALPLLDADTTHREHQSATTRALPVLSATYGPRAPRLHCPHGRHLWLNKRTGEVVPESCRRNTCLPCARLKTKKSSAAIALASPTHMFHFTGLSEDWSDTRERMNAVTRYLRRAGLHVEWAYVVEVNPQGTGAHCHGFLHGDPVEPLLSSALKAAGLGRVYVFKPVEHLDGIGYLFKEAQHNEVSLTAFLKRNGGYLHHTTRGFWRDADGFSISLPEALRLANRAGSGASEWVLLRQEARAGGVAA